MRAELGSVVAAGDAIADVIDPIAGSTTTLYAGTSGMFYVFARHPYVVRGATVAKIAGRHPLGDRNLLGHEMVATSRPKAGRQAGQG
jgi:predicted deacylase